MPQIILVLLGGSKATSDDAPEPHPAVRIDEVEAQRGAFDLLATDDGALCAVPRAGAEPSGRATKATIVGTLKCIIEESHPAWYLVARGGRIGVNGSGVPLSLTRLDPGALLSVGRRFYQVCILRQVTPGPAPSGVGESPCPVCGEALSAAPVVQCPGAGCTRWTHLERPDVPEDPDALNCFLATGDHCPACRAPATLGPVVAPEPHEKLAAVGLQQHEWAVGVPR